MTKTVTVNNEVVAIVRTEDVYRQTTCGACGGTGDGVHDKIEGTLPCTTCRGSGTVYTTR